MDAMEEYAVHNVECSQNAVPFIMLGEPLVLFVFLCQNLDVPCTRASGHGAVELAVSENGLVQENANFFAKRLSLAFYL